MFDLPGFLGYSSKHFRIQNLWPRDVNGFLIRNKPGRSGKEYSAHSVTFRSPNASILGSSISFTGADNDT